MKRRNASTTSNISMQKKRDTISPLQAGPDWSSHLYLLDTLFSVLQLFLVCDRDRGSLGFYHIRQSEASHFFSFTISVHFSFFLFFFFFLVPWARRQEKVYGVLPGVILLFLASPQPFSREAAWVVLFVSRTVEDVPAIETQIPTPKI